MEESALEYINFSVCSFLLGDGTIVTDSTSFLAMSKEYFMEMHICPARERILHNLYQPQVE